MVPKPNNGFTDKPPWQKGKPVSSRNSVSLTLQDLASQQAEPQLPSRECFLHGVTEPQ